MIEADLYNILQVDATIIVGVLILLTLTKLAKSVEENLPVAVAWIVLPFGLSAIFALFGILLNSVNTNISLWLAFFAIISTILGFAYLMFTILDFTRKPKKKK